MRLPTSRRRSGTGLAFFLNLAVAGCSNDGGDTSVRRWTVGDTLVVENSAPIHSARGRLVPVARYGAFEDAGPAALARVYSLAVSPNGDVILYDNEQGIKRFDVGGDFKNWVAKAGKGPGEVGYAPALAVAPNGGIAALDLENRRLLIVDPNGEARTIRFPDVHPRYHEDALHYRDDGTLAVGVNPAFTPGGRAPTPRLAYLVFATDGSLSDSVFVPPAIWQRCPTRSEHRYTVGFWEDKREPYIPKAVWALAPDGTLAVGCPDRYEFVVQRPDGTVLRIGRVGAVRVELTGEQQAFLARWSELPRLPDVRPVYARLILPGDGRIWVWPNQPMEQQAPPAAVQEQTGVTLAWRLSSRGSFDVFEADGRWLGTVPVPPELAYSGFPTESPVVIRGDTLWAITRDVLGVNYVTRYAVDWD